MTHKIATTSLENLKPVGSAGDVLYDRVRAVVEQELGPGYAAALAEPVPLRGGKGVDWYAENDEYYRPVSSLGAAELASARSWFAQFVSAAQVRIAALEAAGDMSSKSKALALRAATSLAEPDALAVKVTKGDDTAPAFIIYGWGFQRIDVLKAEAAVLTETGAGRPAQRIIPPPAGIGLQTAAARSGPMPAVDIAEKTLSEKQGCRPAFRFVPMTLSISVALSLGALYGLLLPACGFQLPFGITLPGLASSGVGCRGQSGSDAAAGLLAEIARMEESLAQRDASCAAVPPAADQRFETRLNEENSGEIQVSLVWNTTDDLDLFIYCAGDGVISFKSKKACNGELDVDANVKDATLTSEPAENIVWKTSRPPAGSLGIVVGLAKRRSPGSAPVIFKVRLVKAGVPQEFEGALTGGGDRAEIHRFQS